MQHGSATTLPHAGGAAAGRMSEALISPLVRRLGLLWVGVSAVFITVVSAFVHTPDAYIFVLIFMACGAYTTPAIVFGWHAVGRAPRADQACYRLLYAGLVSAWIIGVAMLVGLVTGWRWGNVAGTPAVALSGLFHLLGLTKLVRSRSGRRALSVDVIEAVASVVAVAAPLVVLWGPAVATAEAAWLTVPASLAFLFTIFGTYWGIVFLVRLGPGRGAFEMAAVGLCLIGALNAALQTAQGVSGFTLPAPPLVFVNCLSMSMYLLIPLNVPLLLRPGLDRLPPQAQVRGGKFAPSVALTGLLVLLATTVVMADERPWAVPFALGVVSLLFVLGAFRQMAAVGETRRLYQQVEEASDQRRRLLTQLLERSVHDRRRFAGQMYEQAVAAYTSFAMLAGQNQSPAGPSSVVASASALVGGDLARQADSVRELVLAIRPLDGDRHRPQRLGIPIAAYLAALYGDDPAPQLTIDVADELALDWIVETVLLQITQEALHNVWRHSDATTVHVAIEAIGEAVGLRITDDGRGFDPAAVPEGSGTAAMRTSAAVIGGTFAVESRPGIGTTVVACLGPDGPDRSDGSDGSAIVPSAEVASSPVRALRLVPNPPDPT